MMNTIEESVSNRPPYAEYKTALLNNKELCVDISGIATVIYVLPGYLKDDYIAAVTCERCGTKHIQCCSPVLGTSLPNEIHGSASCTCGNTFDVTLELGKNFYKISELAGNDQKLNELLGDTRTGNETTSSLVCMDITCGNKQCNGHFVLKTIMEPTEEVYNKTYLPKTGIKMIDGHYPLLVDCPWCGAENIILMYKKPQPIGLLNETMNYSAEENAKMALEWFKNFTDAMGMTTRCEKVNDKVV